MPVPIGHYREISQPRPGSARERWIVGAAVGMLAILVVAVVIAFTSVQRRSANGCIDVSAATFIGGSNLYRCGSSARQLCAAPTTPGLHNLAFRQALSEACRRADLPVPPAPRAS